MTSELWHRHRKLLYKEAKRKKLLQKLGVFNPEKERKHKKIVDKLLKRA